MSSDYDSIRADNIREYGEGTRHLSFLGRLYTDRTHFIFELLQNAEDAGAAKILFQLFEDRLEVKHDGRPFNELDVRGVCGVGEGTKAEDLTQIGKFGIGFKSVYAYTSAPEVHSGVEHFRIEHYVRPYKAATKVPGDSWTTLFVFAFDAPGVEPQTAMHEIAERLRNLSARTLLFLRKIEKIEYKLPDNTGGFYLRGKPVPRGQARQVTVIGQNNGHEENWLVFDRPLSVPDPHKLDRAKTVWVEIGFKLEANTKDQTERIVRIKESPLVVYFPTEKSTRFGFLIQGPYKTTPSRDNIPKGDDWNAKLVKETTLLLVDALQRLKKMGLLTVALLNALPIRMDDFPEDGMFYPIVEAVRDNLLDQELLPANDGMFVSARNAKLASADWLRKLLTSDQLRDLFSSKYQLNWLSSEITQKLAPDLRNYLINELDVEEVTPDSFTSRIEENFLAKQSDKWIIDFYKCLNKVPHLWNSNQHPPLLFRSKPIIKTEDDKLIAPYSHKRKYYSYGSYITEDQNDVFLPPEGETSFTIVKRCVAADNEARQFLTNLGLEQPDIYNEIHNNILPKYNSDIEISPEEHKKHIDTVLRAIRSGDEAKRNNLIEKIKSLGFISAINSGTNDCEYKQPKDLYFQTEGLRIFFEGNSDIWFINEELTESSKKSFFELGVSNKIRTEKRKRDDLKEIRIIWENKHKVRGVNGFDYRCTIDGLEYALNNPSFEKSQFIWNQLLRQHIDSIKGTIESKKDDRYVYADFVPDKHEIKYSLMGQLLIEKHWLPDKNYQFHMPGELSLDDLPDTFQRNEKLADQLGMKKDVVAKLAEEAGVSVDDINLIKQLKEHPDVYEKIKADILVGEKKAEFPEKILKNAERRKGKIIQKYRDAPKKKYEKKNLSIKTTENTIDPRTWLREIYTNKKGQMICQICQEEMPFKKRNGEYYFEAIELLNDFDREMEELHIALCPLCAAMYNEFVKHDEGAMESLKNELMNSEDSELPLQLGKLTSVRFVERHLQDIRTIIEAKE